MIVTHAKHVASIHFHVVSPLVWRSRKSAHALKNCYTSTLMPMDDCLNTNKYAYIRSIDSSTLNVHYPDIGIKSALKQSNSHSPTQHEFAS